MAAQIPPYIPATKKVYIAPILVYTPLRLNILLQWSNKVLIAPATIPTTKGATGWKIRLVDAAKAIFPAFIEKIISWTDRLYYFIKC